MSDDKASDKTGQRYMHSTAGRAHGMRYDTMRWLDLPRVHRLVHNLTLTS